MNPEHTITNRYFKGWSLILIMLHRLRNLPSQIRRVEVGTDAGVECVAGFFVDEAPRNRGQKWIVFTGKGRDEPRQHIPRPPFGHSCVSAFDYLHLFPI